jgi:chemotaxis protein MotB
MYSVSSVNEGKYRVLTHTLEGIFSKSQPNLSINRLEHQWQQAGGYTDRAIPLPMPGAYNADADYQYGVPGDSRPQEAGGALSTAVGEAALAQINAQIQAQFSDLIALGEVRVTSSAAWIEVDIKSNILFDIGQADPSAVAQSLLATLAGILSDKPNAVHVEGFTDDLPIQNDRFPSNWELSAARAAAVLRLLVVGGVAPERLAAVGYGQYQPIAGNDTPEGRSKNRRVVLVISKGLSARRSLDNPVVDNVSQAVNISMPAPQQAESNQVIIDGGNTANTISLPAP